MPRRYEVSRMSADRLRYLFPHEILSLLDNLVRDIPVDLSRPVERPAALHRQLSVLERVLDHIESRADGRPETRALTRRQAEYLAYWIPRARAAAARLRETQPETPLGFPDSRRAVLANVLFASWIDLSDGGKIPVHWEPL